MSSEGNVSLDQSRTQEKVSAVQFPCHKTKKIKSGKILAKILAKTFPARGGFSRRTS